MEKSIYIAPQIELIKLDNEISLALESGPPELPGEEVIAAKDYFNNDPFKLTV
jgi:hypothetical protein